MAPTERLLKDRAHPRLNMVNCQLRPNGVVEERLIRAFESTPMEEFVPPAIQSLVYSDADLSLTPDYPFKRWLMAPLTLGLLLQLAAIKPSDKVLILGCGTGYSLALVAQLAACVVGLECDGDLADQARAYVEGHGLAHVKVIK
jgi:protein-L-isoaspartate(D-aspartate) O-methyltransferase